MKKNIIFYMFVFYICIFSQGIKAEDKEYSFFIENFGEKPVSKRKKFSIEQKRQALQEFYYGKTKKDISEKYGVALRSFNVWIRIYRSQQFPFQLDESKFFNDSHSNEYKKIVLEAILNKVPKKVVVEKYGVSKDLIDRWIQAYACGEIPIELVGGYKLLFRIRRAYTIEFKKAFLHEYYHSDKKEEILQTYCIDKRMVKRWNWICPELCFDS